MDLHRVAPLLKPAQILKALGESAQGRVIHRAVQLLTVAGDERDGVSLVDELDDIINMVLFAAKLAGKNLAYAFNVLLLGYLICNLLL